jgi:hypothetical protein
MAIINVFNGKHVLQTYKSLKQIMFIPNCLVQSFDICHSYKPTTLSGMYSVSFKSWLNSNLNYFKFKYSLKYSNFIQGEPNKLCYREVYVKIFGLPCI